MIDYKISHILRKGRSPDGTTEVLIRVYEGDVTTEDEEVGGVTQPVTRYRRNKVLGEWAIKFKGDISPVRDERDEYLRRMLDDKLQGLAKILMTTVLDEQSQKLSYNEVIYEKDEYTARTTR